MIVKFTLALVAVLATFLPPSSPEPSAGGAPPRFPTVGGSTLERQHLVLPKDLAGERNLLVIAFEREQQAAADTWTRDARSLERAHPALRCYELLVQGRSNPLFRWWFDAAMRSSISDPAAREHTIVLYTNEAAFRHALGIADQKQVVALVVDRAGGVLWHARGASTEPLQKELDAALAPETPDKSPGAGAAKAPGL